MPKRTNKSAGNKGVLAVMLVALLGAAGFAAYVRYSPGAAHVSSTVGRPSEPDVTIQAKPEDRRNRDDHGAQSLTLFVPAVIDNDVKLDKQAKPSPQGVQPEVSLLNETLESLEIPGALATGIDVKNGLALVDFNQAIQKGYGTIEEGNLIKALQMALGQFGAIDKFQIVVEGKTIDTLGNIDLTTPVDVIRPGQAKPSNSPAGSILPEPN